MNIGIIGLGLIGGSLALALRQCFESLTEHQLNELSQLIADRPAKHAGDYKILGVSRREQICQLAIEQGYVDEASTNLTLLSTANIIFICTPIATIVPTVEQLVPHLASTTVLTDVGSVKASIVTAIAPLWTNFVGGHPMAGTTESGLLAAQLDLFVDRPYVLTPIVTTPSIAVNKVVALVKLLQSKIYYCSPAEHDRAVAWISHLPVMVSASLISACLQEPNSELLKLAQSLASSGFRDTSRVGGGNPELGMMMAQYNAPALLDALYIYRQQLDEVVQTIEQANWEALAARLQTNQQARPDFVG